MSDIAAYKMSEIELDAAVRRLCENFGLYAYHNADSRRIVDGAAGFPDWVIIGPRGVLFRENKSQHGRPTAQQRRIGYLLTLAGQAWGIWRPSDLLDGTIRRELLMIK